MSDTDELYVISYLLLKTENNEVIGYAELAARVCHLTHEIRSDDQISNIVADDLDDLVKKTEDNMLKWDSLRSFVETALDGDVGSMFLTIESEETGPNEWEYKFKSNAPEAVLETKLENISDREEMLKQKIKNSARVDKEGLYDTIFQT